MLYVFLLFSWSSWNKIYMWFKENKNTSSLISYVRTFFAFYIHINFTAVWKWNEIDYHSDAYHNISSRYT